MRETEESILNIFKNNPSKDLNSEFLARQLYPEEYIHIDNLLASSEKSNMHDGKRRKFQLQRKILYYLGKLSDHDIIKVARIAEKGEKYFTLKAEDGEMIIKNGYKRIVISKPSVNTSIIEPYEARGVMQRYAPDSWINRFNSILLECNGKDLNKMSSLVKECLGNVNDAIALNEFEQLLNTAKDPKSVREFLEKMSREAENTDKTISILVNIAEAVNNLEVCIAQFADLNPKKVNLIFNIGHKDLQKHSKVLGYIVEQFSRAKIKINFKNSDISIAPYFKGRAGIYSFDDDDWGIYMQKVRDNVIGISCAQSQIAININRFFEVYHTDTEFRQAVLNAAKALLIANTIQRRKSNEYFKNINVLNNTPQEFYKYSRDYIRFWNYDWHKDIEHGSNLFELIKSTKDVVDTFCYSEETIFKSCGIPIRFKIAFSSAFRNFDPLFMGERDYKKATVKRAEDYYTGEIKNFLTVREKMFEIFDGGDRLRIFRTADFQTTDILHELGILLNAYKIPFFTYDFSSLRGVVKLTNFM